MYKKNIPKKLSSTQEKLSQNFNLPTSQYIGSFVTNQLQYPEITGLQKKQSSSNKIYGSNISSQYHTVKEMSIKQNQSQNKDVYEKGEQNFIDDDIHDFNELLHQQFKNLNISQILPLEQDAAEQQNQDGAQINEKIEKNHDDQSLNNPQLLKIVKQINQQEKLQQRKKLFNNLSQSQIKSLILGSYISKLVSKSLNSFKDMTFRFSGSSRIPKDYKRLLLIFLKQIIKKVELQPKKFKPEGYQSRIEQNVNQTIQFSRKIQAHFTSEKNKLILKLTKVYQNMDYIHAEAKKILYRNLTKITNQYQNYKQKIKAKNLREKQRFQQNSCASNTQRSVVTRAWAASLQNYQFSHLKSQRRKNLVHSEANRDESKSLNGNMGKFCKQEDIDYNSQNNCVFGHHNLFQTHPIIQNGHNQMKVNMQKNSDKKFYQSEFEIRAERPSKQKQKQKKNKSPSQTHNKFIQISKSLQKWKAREKQHNNFSQKKCQKQQQTQTDGKKQFQIRKEYQLSFNRDSKKQNLGVGTEKNLLYSQTPNGNAFSYNEYNLKFDSKLFDGKIQSNKSKYLQDNLQSEDEQSRQVKDKVEIKNKDSLTISVSTHTNNDLKLKKGQNSYNYQNSLMNSTGKINNSIDEISKFKPNNQKNVGQQQQFLSQSQQQSSVSSNQQNSQLLDLTKIIDAKIREKDITNSCILEKQEQDQSQYQNHYKQNKKAENQKIIIKSTKKQVNTNNRKEAVINKLNNQSIKKKANQIKQNPPPLHRTNIANHPSNSNLEPYRKLSSFLKQKLSLQICQQFQSYFITYYNSKPPFHVQKRRKLLDFVFQLCQQVQKTKKNIVVDALSDKNAKLGIQVCKMLNEQKLTYLKSICIKYYKDYFPVDEKRTLFSDVKSIIILLKECR